MNKRTVWVSQEQHRDTGGREKYDLSSAKVYGDLEYLLTASANPFRPDKLIEELHDKLRNYDADQDSLLLMGNPCVIGWVTAVAAFYGHGVVTQLQWDGRRGLYNPIRCDLLLRPAN